MKTISIISTRPALAQAIELHMKGRHPNTKFVTVSKIGDAPTGSELASRGLPQFVPGTEGVRVHNVGIRYDKDATPAQRQAQWAKISAPDATIEDILPELGFVEELFVIPAKAYSEAKAILTESRLNIAEAETPSETLAAYRSGFNALKAILLSTAAPAAVQEELPAGEDETPL